MLVDERRTYMESNKAVVDRDYQQFNGECNPFDKLWALSIEIGRNLLFRTKRIGTTLPDSFSSLMKEYNETYYKVSELPRDKIEALLSDSYFNHCAFYRDQNPKLMNLAKESLSTMDYRSQFASEWFLKATLGEEEGAKEYKRRCSLVKLGHKYDNTFLYDVMTYLLEVSSDNGDEYIQAIKAFLAEGEKLGYTIGSEDIILMIESNETASYRFYLGAEGR